MKTRYLLLPFLFACSDPTGASPPRSEGETKASVPAALDPAHEAYLKSDWLTMSERVRDVLVDRSASDLARENAFELLDKAYEATRGKLPSRFVLPKDVQVVKLGSMRGQHAWATYRTIFLYVRVAKGFGSHVTDLSVRSEPGGVAVLDRASGLGAVRQTQTADGDEVVVEAKGVSEALPDGVVSIRVGFDDGRQLDTWVIARGLSSSSSPEIASPAQAASLSDATPTLEWVPFRSPEYAPFERRTLSLWIADDKTEKEAFDHWTGEPGEMRRMKVDTPLAPGSYWFALTAGEERSFGPILLSRQSQRGVPFSVIPR